MSDFDHAIDLARDEEYTPPPVATAPPGWELPPPRLPHWTPDAPAPLATSGPMPGLFMTAGVDEMPSPLMTPEEQRQRADEAALLAKGGQFTGDERPSWSQSRTAKDPPPGPSLGERFENFREQVADTKETYEEKLGYPGPMAGMVATGAVAIEDLVGDLFSNVHGARDHIERALEAPSPTLKLEESAKAAGGVGSAILDVTTVADPANALVDDGGGAAVAGEPALASTAAGTGGSGDSGPANGTSRACERSRTPRRSRGRS